VTRGEGDVNQPLEVPVLTDVETEEDKNEKNRVVGSFQAALELGRIKKKGENQNLSPGFGKNKKTWGGKSQIWGDQGFVGISVMQRKDVEDRQCGGKGKGRRRVVRDRRRRGGQVVRSHYLVRGKNCV